MPSLNTSETFKTQYEPITETGCWIWMGSTKTSRGEERGRYMIGGKREYAHRIAYRLFKGDVPEGMQVNHHCDNTICVNPDHLYLGTQQDNVTDRVVRGREGNRHGEINGRAKLTESQVRHIRDSPESNVTLAERYEVSDVLVGLIKRRKAWQHLEVPRG